MSARGLLLLVVLVGLGPAGCWCPTVGLADQGELGHGSTLAILNSSSFPIERVEVVVGNAIIVCVSDDQLGGAPIPPGGQRRFELAPGFHWLRLRVHGRALSDAILAPAGGQIAWIHGRQRTPLELRWRRARSWPRAAFVLIDSAGSEHELADLVLAAGAVAVEGIVRLDLVQTDASGAQFHVIRRDGLVEEVRLQLDGLAVGHAVQSGHEVSVPVAHVASIARRPDERDLPGGLERSGIDLSDGPR